MHPGGDLAVHAGRPHHVEFVEVGGRDRQEAQPLQQRMAAVLRFLEDAAIELQPRQLAVVEASRTRAAAPGLPAASLAAFSFRLRLGGSWTIYQCSIRSAALLWQLYHDATIGSRAGSTVQQQDESLVASSHSSAGRRAAGAPGSPRPGARVTLRCDASAAGRSRPRCGCRGLHGLLHVQRK